MTPLWSDENDDLAVTIYADASADIRDKHTDTRWRMGRVALQEEGPVDIGHVWLRTTRSICEQYPGRFRGEAIGDTLRFTLLGREGRMVGQFTCRVRLDGLWLELQIGDINETLPSLVFPPPIESESLVLPMNVGRWVRAPLYKEQGLALGSEEGADYGVPLVDWIENRHRRVAGESIPLWPLVYHDAAFCARYDGGLLATGATNTGAPHWLANMLWGYPLLWDVRDLAVWANDQTDFAATTHVDAWHQQIGLDEMLSHRYLTEDCEVEQAIFTNGAIIANFAPEPRTVEGVRVSGYGYVVKG
jgi:hypothetical protein